MLWMRLKRYFLRLFYRQEYFFWRFRPAGFIFLPNGGGPVQVRPLRLYELDIVPYDDPGPFRYFYQMAGGKTAEAIYDVSQWPEPPKMPETPEPSCELGSQEADLWKVYHTYQAALNQRVLQVEAGEQHAIDMAHYILNNCLSPEDRARVMTPEDYEVIYQAVVCPEVTMEDIETALVSTFPGLIWG